MVPDSNRAARRGKRIERHRVRLSDPAWPVPRPCRQARHTRLAGCGDLDVQMAEERALADGLRHHLAAKARPLSIQPESGGNDARRPRRDPFDIDSRILHVGRRQRTRGQDRRQRTDTEPSNTPGVENPAPLVHLYFLHVFRIPGSRFHPLVNHRQQDQSQQRRCEEAAHHDRGERALRLRTDARRQQHRH